MLKQTNHYDAHLVNRHMQARSKQNGVVLLIALIVLVAMTLAAIALVRSVDTTNLIAGNLAFQQSATNAGDVGSENAIEWLQTKNIGTTLRVSDLAAGYSAVWDSSTANRWDDIVTESGITPVVAGEDQAGNTVSYIIQRLCKVEGATADPNSPATGCATPPKIASSIGSSLDSGTVNLFSSNQRYYRITAKIVGPRNTTSYTQTIIAM